MATQSVHDVFLDDSATRSEMMLGTAERPVRVAIVGAGPAGFFAADCLLSASAPVFDVDMIERLPTPFGLVRSGVAPDHQKIKSVVRTFERTAQSKRFRFLGNVEVGRDLTVSDLAEHYDQVVYAIGSSSDRRLGIPGEELGGCHAATAFVGWYNAHPDFRDFPFDLSAQRAAVVGAGNVAMDVARILLRDPKELATTDIARHAILALEESRIREVVLLARRSPAHAAFDPRELEDIAALSGVDVLIDRASVEADLAASEGLSERQKKNLALMRELAAKPPGGQSRIFRLLFGASPVELLGDAHRRVQRVKVERNASVIDERGRTVARGTGEHFEIEAGLVLRSIGYTGLPLPGLPFDEQAGVIPNGDGRILDPSGVPIPGAYVVGWIRRGPLGVIGTNKADASHVAKRIIADVPTLEPVDEARRSHGAVDALLARRGVQVTTYADWLHLDLVELSEGRASGKLREKLTSVEQMMNELLRAAHRHA